VIKSHYLVNADMTTVTLRQFHFIPNLSVFDSAFKLSAFYQRYRVKSLSARLISLDTVNQFNNGINVQFALPYVYGVVLRNFDRLPAVDEQSYLNYNGVRMQRVDRDFLISCNPLVSTAVVDSPVGILQPSAWLQTDQATVPFIGLSMLIVKPPPATSLFTCRILLTAEV